jgi:hypothetical protein
MLKVKETRRARHYATSLLESLSNRYWCRYTTSLLRAKIRSHRRTAVVGSLFAFVAIFLFLAPSMQVPFASAVKGVTTLCAGESLAGDVAGGIYPAAGGAFVEGSGTGDIYFCSGGTAKLVATSPSNQYLGYFGMGGVKTSTFGLVLALTNFNIPGFWLCYHATTSGCGSKSAPITFPSSFCSSEPNHSCVPGGVALDSSLNLYYVDFQNKKLVECFRSGGYNTCSNLPASSHLSGSPEYVFLQGSTFYIADGSCKGHVWKGSKTSLSIIATVLDSLGGIALSNKNPTKTMHLYVADTGSCHNAPAHILDVTDGKSLPTPFGSSQPLAGLDSSLQFTVYDFKETGSGAAYQTSDTS